MQIRRAQPDDIPALARVFFAAIREGPSPYTEAQRMAWMAAPPEVSRLRARLSEKVVFVGVQEEENTGFMTLDPGGYIDLAFILHQSRGQGLFRALFYAIEAHALAKGETRLWTHASLLAQPAFHAMGFVVMHHEKVEIAGAQLSRAQMEKHLT